MGSSASPVVLVVEDEPDVRELATTILEMQGYAVLQATDGAEAITMLESRSDISILFTDIVMPGSLDGFELAHEAKQLRPDLRVIYTSGYIKEIPWGQKGVGYGPLLPKPWRKDQLVSTVESMLGGSGET
jgi:CheY-like chemotaxis protein